MFYAYPPSWEKWVAKQEILIYVKKKLNLTSTVDAAQSLNLYEVSKKMNNSKKKFNFKC